MRKKAHEWFVSVTEEGPGNLPESAGAFLTLISLVLPWFRADYPGSSAWVTGAEKFFQVCGQGYDFHPLFPWTFLYLLAVPLASLLTFRYRLPAWLAIAGLALLGLTLYLQPVPFSSLSFGLIVTCLGLLLIVSGFFKKAP